MGTGIHSLDPSALPSAPLGIWSAKFPSTRKPAYRGPADLVASISISALAAALTGARLGFEGVEKNVGSK